MTPNDLATPNTRDVVIGCVAENTGRFLGAALRLVRSVRWFAGTTAAAPMVVCCVDECDPVYRTRLESLGATVRIVPRFEPAYPLANKLRFLEQPEIAAARIALLLDCDTVLVQDPRPWLRDDVVRAKIADLPTVPTATLASICRHFGIAEPTASYRTTFDDVPTVWYCNSGVVAVPAARVPQLFTRWATFVRELLARPDLLHEYRHYWEQSALALAYLSAPIGFEEFPVEMNFPLHLTDRPARVDLHDVDPVILHYHSGVDHHGFIRPSPYRRPQQRIEAFNSRLAQCQDAR